MPARPAADPRPLWAVTDKGKIVPCPKGLPADAVLSCREGDPSWGRADPASVAPPPRGGRAAPAGLYDVPEGV